MMFLLSSSKRIPCYLGQFSTRFMSAKAQMIFFHHFFIHPFLQHLAVHSSSVRPSIRPSIHSPSIHPSSSIQFHDACAEAANGMIITGET